MTANPGDATASGIQARPYFSISQLAARHGLSRSTLLYYDRIGLLRAASRSSAGYRRYSPGEAERLERVVRYRQAGLSLLTIRRVLDAQEPGLMDALAARLLALNQEIRRLREQQRFILGQLHGRKKLESLAFMSKAKFVALLKAGGFTEEDMARWHVAFERSAPLEHQRFLEFLCIPDDEIRKIRDRSARPPARRAMRPA
jgi:DNA-binding transcriptional MerR regulator